MPITSRNANVQAAIGVLALLIVLCVGAVSTGGAEQPVAAEPSLQEAFRDPPPSARPWVYWFWLNGNITRQGITADLEAMQRVGIGGVLIMEVDQGIPPGPVAFMSPQWRDLFRHVLAEAARLGLQVNMTNDAGWNGSGGPWIKPEQSMQKVVWSETEFAGPKHVEADLPQAQAVADYYRDIAVLAFPTPGSYRIEKIDFKAGYQAGLTSPTIKPLPAEMVIDRGRIVDVGSQVDPHHRLAWDVPPGLWTVLRIGHTSTGVHNAPAPASGCGLECDKLSKEGIGANFNGMMNHLADDAGPAAGKTLVTTHIDSWENGSQNWTTRMPQEFKARRGYDIVPFLPVMSGRVVGSLEISERFLWDLRRTVSELVVENYAAGMCQLAHRRGLRFTIEAYGGPCDDLPYAQQCDEPMGEFWIGGGALDTCRGMASAAHLCGKTIVGAEAFTADNTERWQMYPGSMKALGDRAFCEGINRFVFHRYALQPWTEDRRPGMTMGPWGTHYERTQTWWELTPDWHRYLARCQFMLRQGRFVADLCYLEEQDSPQGLPDHPRQGYGWDHCNPEVVLTRMSVRDGRLMLPDGMSYRLLVLPESRTMTPALLDKLKELVEAGATILGPPPLRSPSLDDYPKCDAQVRRLADELWGNCDGKSVLEHRLGKGRVVWGVPPEKLLADGGLPPDFAACLRLDSATRLPLQFIHRQAAGTDIYFISNPVPQDLTASVTLRVAGKTPELWRPDTGRFERAPLFKAQGATTTLTLPLEPSGSVFVVFRDAGGLGDQAVDLLRGGKSIYVRGGAPRIVVQKAAYGVLGDPRRTRDVKASVQRIADTGALTFQVAEMAAGDDPAFGIVKTLALEYTIGDESFRASATDPQYIMLATPSEQRVAQVCRRADGRLCIEAREGGLYDVQLGSGQTRRVEAPAVAKPLEIAGPWELRFPPRSSAPESVALESLISWTQHKDDGVKYFSGTATYVKEFDVPAELIGQGKVLWLDLGSVRVFAQVKLNDKDLGLLWKPPFRLDISALAKPGKNRLEVKVTNLWPNRLIGDEQLPEDSPRNPDGTLKAWPDWLLGSKPSPAGRQTFTTWRLWHKDDALLESGLLGPVMLRPALRVEVK